MKYSQNSAFTLIEMIIAITIFVLLWAMVFWPYAYYLNKSKVKHTQKEATQLIYEAKNMALNGRVGEEKNISVWVYFDSNNADKIKVIPFEYATTLENISTNSSLITNALSQTGVLNLTLQPGITFQKIAGEDKWLIYFQAINGSGWVLVGNNFSQQPGNIDIEFAFKDATSWALRQSITYIQETQIVDY